MIAATLNERVCRQNCFGTRSGGYWLRQMRQLHRAPLKVPHIVSFCCIYFEKNFFSPKIIVICKKKGLHFNLISNFSQKTRPKNKQLYANGLFPFIFLLKQPIFKIFSNTKIT